MTDTAGNAAEIKYLLKRPPVNAGLAKYLAFAHAIAQHSLPHLCPLMHVFVHLRSSEKESKIQRYPKLLYSFSFETFYEVPHFSTAVYSPGELLREKLHTRF